MFPKVIIICLIVTLSIVCVYGFEPPHPEVKFHRPRGFEVSIPARPGISLFAFHGNKNRPINGLESGQWNKNIHHPINGKFTFVERETIFDSGDKLHFWIHVIHNGFGYNRLGLVQSPAGGSDGETEYSEYEN